jgi:hypothetical protein
MHKPCSNPECREHGIAASLAATNEFWKNHPDGGYRVEARD